MQILSFNETVSLYSRTEQTSPYEFSSLSIVQTRGKLSDNCSDYIDASRKQSENMEDVECKDWTCVANGVTCSKPICPSGTKIVAKVTGEICPSYECIVSPPNEKKCKVHGRLITTFDGTSFKYDVCDHVLARDKLYNTWSVRSEYLECRFFRIDQRNANFINAIL